MFAQTDLVCQPSILLGSVMLSQPASTIWRAPSRSRLIREPFNKNDENCRCTTMVDGRNPANQSRLVVYPVIYRVWYIPGWCRISSINSMKSYFWWFRNPAITTERMKKNLVNNGIAYQPQLVQDSFQQQYASFDRLTHSHGKSSSFLVDTIKMADFPWLCRSAYICWCCRKSGRQEKQWRSNENLFCWQWYFNVS